MDESHSKCISDRHSIFTSISRLAAATAVTFSLLTRNRSINLQKPVPLLQKAKKQFPISFFLSSLAGKIHLLNLGNSFPFKSQHRKSNQRCPEVKVCKVEIKRNRNGLWPMSRRDIKPKRAFLKRASEKKMTEFFCIFYSTARTTTTSMAEGGIS